MEQHLTAANTYSLNTCVFPLTCAKPSDHHTFLFLSALQSQVCSQALWFCSASCISHGSACFWITKSFAQGAGRFMLLDGNCRIWQFQPGKNWQPTLGSLGVSTVGDGMWTRAFLHFCSEIHHHYHHHYYDIIISLLLDKKKDF